MTTRGEIERLRRDVSLQVDRLDQAVSDVEDAARRAVQVDVWVRRRPLVTVAGAFIVGWWCGRR